MAADCDRARAELEAIGDAVAEARRRHVPWKELVRDYGFCRTRLYMLQRNAVNRMNAKRDQERCSLGKKGLHTAT